MPVEAIHPKSASFKTYSGGNDSKAVRRSAAIELLRWGPTPRVIVLGGTSVHLRSAAEMHRAAAVIRDSRPEGAVL